MKNIYHFNAKLYLYSNGKKDSSWHFITLPTKVADEINFFYADQKRGWGSLPVKVTVGESVWNTSIFPQKETKSFFLPIKAEVRKKEQINANDNIEVELEIN